MPTCTTNDCHNEATYVVYWPGSVHDKCEKCANVAKQVAEAMGFELAIRPIANEEKK